MNRLRELRKEKKLKQQAVADAIGLNRSTYANYEGERREADHVTLMKLADFYDVSVDYLLGKEQNEPAAECDGLRNKAIERVQSLPDPALTRVLDFLDGLEAGREIAAAEAAADGQDGGSAE